MARRQKEIPDDVQTVAVTAAAPMFPTEYAEKVGYCETAMLSKPDMEIAYLAQTIDEIDNDPDLFAAVRYKLRIEALSKLADFKLKRGKVIVEADLIELFNAISQILRRYIPDEVTLSNISRDFKQLRFSKF